MSKVNLQDIIPSPLTVVRGNLAESVLVNIGEFLSNGWFDSKEEAGKIVLTLRVALPRKLSDTELGSIVDQLVSFGWHVNVMQAFTGLNLPGADVYDKQYNPTDLRVYFLFVNLTHN